MKKIFALLIGILISATITFSQDAPPQAFSFQALILKPNGSAVKNNYVSLQISILRNNANGIVEYQEVHTTMTNNSGGVNIQIGEGTTLLGDFAAIPWADDKWFLLVEVDPGGGTDYIEMTRMQLLSVPYALYSGGAREAGHAVEAEHAVNADNSSFAYEAGHAATADFATVAGSAVRFHETDPVFSVSPSATISEGDKTNWNDAYSWGNHADVGYLTAEVDGDVTNEIQDLVLDADMLNITNDPDATGIDLTPYKQLTESQVEEYAANDVSANRVPLSNNGVKFSNSNIYQDGYYVGIGIANPSQRLEVYGNIKASLIYGNYFESTNNIKAINDVYADDFRYNDVVTKYLNIPACAGNYSTPFTNGYGHGFQYSYISTYDSYRHLYFNVDIPYGARIRGVRLYLSGNGGTTYWYLRQLIGTSFYQVTSGNDNSQGTWGWTDEVTINYLNNNTDSRFVLDVYNATLSTAVIAAVQIRYEIDKL